MFQIRKVTIDDTSQGGTDGTARDGRSSETTDVDVARDGSHTARDGNHTARDGSHGATKESGDDGTSLIEVRRRARDGRQAAREDGEVPRDGHPMPWRGLDYGAANRVMELDETYEDGDVTGRVVEGDTARTGFNPADVPRKQRQFERLEQLQHGVGESDRRSQHRAADVQRDLGTFGSQLGATVHQRERARWLLDAIGIDSLARNYESGVAVLAALSVAIDEERTHLARDATHEPQSVQSVTRDEQYVQLRESLGVSSSGMHTVRDLIREHDVYESPNSDGGRR